MDLPTIAVLVPCRDEAATIGRVVEEFTKALPTAVIYVYDNGSGDDTAAQARESGAVVRSVTPPGKGNVVRRMFADVDADVYVLVDGDGTYDASLAPDLVAGVVEQGHDLVNAARRPVPGSEYRPGHAFGSRLLAGLVGWTFHRPVGDMLSGYKAMSRRLVRSFPALSRGFEIETELTVHALEVGASTLEVTGSYRSRPDGSHSKLDTFGDGARISRSILALARQGRPLAFFSLVGLVLAATGIALGVPVVLTFAHHHVVPRLPTAVLATGLELLAALSFTAGLVLDTVARARREARVLAYLSIGPPLGRPDV